MIVAPMILARRSATHDHGQSARGGSLFPASPRCTLPSARLCQEAADQSIHDVADGLPGLGGVLEVVSLVSEALNLHAPSIRMETENDVHPEAPKSSSDDGRHR